MGTSVTRRDDFFLWPVSVAGYRWVRAEPISELNDAYVLSGFMESSREEYRRCAAAHQMPRYQLMLTGAELENPAAAEVETTSYNPLAGHVALYRLFAQIPVQEIGEDTSGIISFAAEYGLLGGRARQYMLPAQAVSGSNHPPGEGETELAWIDEVAAMREAVELWDAARTRDVDRLAKRIQWRDDYVVYIPPPPPSNLGQRIEKPILGARFKPNDLVKPALHRLMSIVKQQAQGELSLELAWSDADARPRTAVVPTSLLGALWWQFARAIDENREQAECALCRKPFEYSPKVARKSRRYCSDACRVKQHRQQHQEDAR